MTPEPSSRSSWTGSTIAPPLRRVADNLPLTASGWIVVLVGIVSFLAGWRLGWIELFVMAAGCLLALLAAIPFIMGRTRLALERELTPDRVTAGESAYATFTVRNEGARRTRARRIHDHVDGRPRPIDVPGLAVAGDWSTSWRLPTHRRGVHKVGPARVAMTDPFNLLLREAGHTGVDQLWVQPQHVPLASPGAGMAKDLDGPTYDTSPAGDVAFHAVRPYRSGDDIRHIHWMSTARAGEVMVRHYVDNRVPTLAVVLDNNEASWLDLDEFDIAVEIAASLVVSALRERRPVSLHVGEEHILGEGRPVTVQGALDALTLVELSQGFALDNRWSVVVRAQSDVSLTVGITGSRADLDLSTMARSLRNLNSRHLVRVADERDVSNAPVAGMSRSTVATVRQFARVWQEQLK